MCIVSKDIKFCSCEVDDYEELPHYWVLHRYNKTKDLIVLGEVVMYADFLNPLYESSKAVLNMRLNTKEAFDKELAFKENDRFEIILNNNEGKQRMTFCFRFKKGTWVETSYDYFKLASHFDEHAVGIFSEMKK
jgi:hypothetical protein